MTAPRKFYPLLAGSTLPGDWYPGTLPMNIVVGEESVIDSSFCFKHYYSSLPLGARIGKYVTIWRASLAVEENAYLEIGDYSYLSHASLVCSQAIHIGSRVFIAGGVTIADSDFHPVAPAARLADTLALSPLGDRHSRPPIQVQAVVIEDDVWIGYNAAIMKGVRVGAGAIVRPGAMVINDVPPGATVAGNPARIIQQSEVA